MLCWDAAEPSAANYDDVRAGVFFGFKRGENYYLALLEKGPNK